MCNVHLPEISPWPCNCMKSILTESGGGGGKEGIDMHFPVDPLFKIRGPRGKAEKLQASGSLRDMPGPFHSPAPLVYKHAEKLWF